jgi:hypothetical protein
MSDQAMNDARNWVADCTWNEDPDDLEDLSDDQIRKGVNRHYVGGWDQFVEDGNYTHREAGAQ